MSISIATMGKYWPQADGGLFTPRGAPPVIQEAPKPRVSVTNIKMKTIKCSDDNDYIKTTLVGFD